MTRFTPDNTDGYSPEQLAELNRRYAVRIAAYNQAEKLVQYYVAEDVLAEFDMECVLADFDAEG